MERPVKSAALFRMVSRRVLGALWLLVGVVVGLGCSTSQCLRSDCHTSDPVSAEAGQGASSSVPAAKKCSDNAGCDASQGEACVESTCRLACSSHYDCQGFGECLSGTDANNDVGHFCDASQPQKAGQFYAHCPGGDSDCDTANGFLCVGAGSGDLNAYCTIDCKKDTDCADGFACSPLVRPPCKPLCGVAGDGNDRQCVPSDQIGVDKAYQCGTRGATRNVCRPRAFCSSCTNDADCFALPNQICAKDKSGAKICTQPCDPKHPSCPWGSAATCGIWDVDLGQPTCAHRFGKCVGTGKSCEPCLKDSDCGSDGACTSSEFTGEHWCVDLSVSCSCAADSGGTCTGGGCPQTPGGLDMTCVDNSTGSAAGAGGADDAAGLCIGANTVSSLSGDAQTGCWPAK